MTAGDRARRDWLPVWLSLLVWPGAGQLYGGRRLKGLALVAVSTLCGLAFALRAAQGVLRALPAAAAALDPSSLVGTISHALRAEAAALALAALPLLAVWIYAVVDAWRHP